MQASMVLSGERLKAFPVKSGRRRMCTLTTPIQHKTRNPSRGVRQKKHKTYPNPKEISKIVCLQVT